MLLKLFRRNDADILTWEYLDGDISPSRAERLSKILSEKVAARQRFVEAAMMHGMLFDYFKTVHAQDAEERAQSEDGQPRRRKRSRGSAA